MIRSLAKRPTISVLVRLGRWIIAGHPSPSDTIGAPTTTVIGPGAWWRLSGHGASGDGFKPLTLCHTRDVGASKTRCHSERGPELLPSSRRCSAQAGSRTVRTGQVARRRTRSATLPSSARSSPPRPCVPITMRAARSCVASATISLCGTPSGIATRT